MIRNVKGKHYCDGRECGYQLAWFNLDPKEDGAEGEWVCLDCGDSMFSSAPRSTEIAEERQPS